MNYLDLTLDLRVSPNTKGIQKTEADMLKKMFGVKYICRTK